MLANLGGLVAILATIALIGGGVILGQKILWSIDWSRAPKLLPEPVDPVWEDIVRTNFPLSRRIPPVDFDRLLKLVQLFLAKKNIEAAGGLELTDEIRVTVAAQACFLILWLEVGLYPALKTVIVYPSTVVPKYVNRPLRFGQLSDEAPKPILGQSWGQGIVVLSWDSTKKGAMDPLDGHNVVLHEFAHQLDQEDGDADGIPVGLNLSALKPWAEVIERRFQQLERAERRGKRTVLDYYGATNRAEFFAVATEAFFEKSNQLRKKMPDLYHLLADFYRVDPAGGFATQRPVP